MLGKPDGRDEVAYWVHRVVNGRILLDMPTSPEFRRALVIGLKAEIEQRLTAVNDANRRSTSREVAEILGLVEWAAPSSLDLLADLLPKAVIELDDEFKHCPIRLDIERAGGGEARWLQYIQHPDAGVRSNALTVASVDVVSEGKQLPPRVLAAIREMARGEPDLLTREDARRLTRHPQFGEPT